MQYVGRFVSSVYNTITPNINPATLSGAIDVIVVERQIERETDDEDEEDASRDASIGGYSIDDTSIASSSKGPMSSSASISSQATANVLKPRRKERRKVITTEYASTPFHVRFGKMSVLRPAERKVTLHLNNSPDPLPFAMKIGEAGEAFFVVELDGKDSDGGIPDELVTSPILSATTSPEVSAAKAESAQQRQGPSDPSAQHTAPRKLIAEEYVEPLDLGVARSDGPSSMQASSNFDASDTATVRSGTTRRSNDTAATSPSIQPQERAEGEPRKSGEEVNADDDNGDNSGILGSVGNAASKASGVIGAAGAALMPAIGGVRNMKLEKLNRSNSLRDKVHGIQETGADVEGKDPAHKLDTHEHSETKERMQRQDDEHPPDDIKDAQSETERLEIHMRDRTRKLVEDTVEARREKEQERATGTATDGDTQADESTQTAEEQYPAPFGGSTAKGISTAYATTQSDHGVFLGGHRVKPVSSGIPGREDVEPAQVDPRIVERRLSDWRHDHPREDHTSSQDADAVSHKKDTGKYHLDGSSIPTLKAQHKEDLQYMLDIDGYKMTADGEDLAFAEGSRLSSEIPISRSHDGQLSKDSLVTKSGLATNDTNAEALGQSLSTLHLDDTCPSQEHHASLTATLDELDASLSKTFDSSGNKGSGGEGSTADEVSLSRDLVRLTRSLHHGQEARADDAKTRPSLPERAFSRRSQYHDVSLSDTEADADDFDADQEGPDSFAKRRQQQNASARGLSHHRATSMGVPAHSMTDDLDGPVVRDDAGLGLASSTDLEWGWYNKKKAGGRRPRVLSSADLPDQIEAETADRSDLGRLTCDHRDPYEFQLQLGDASHTFSLSLCNTEASQEETAQDGETSAESRTQDIMERFDEFKISYQRFLDDEQVVNDERLVVRYNDRYLTWENASTVLATLSLYRKTLGGSAADLTLQTKPTGPPAAQEGSVWRRWWYRSRGDEALPGTTKADPSPGSTLERANTDSVIDMKAAQQARAEAAASDVKTSTAAPKVYAKTLRLTSDQLKSLNLRKGANTITFSVTSSYSGVATCTARIFLWDSTHQIVVSDIDGTITKSDALGHVFTMIGRDWTHSGVAKLYTDIARNGYRIMYLTSRAIGQADTTRDYLRGITQNNFKLPDGPVIMSPDRLMASLHREVILRKPEVFKMACLRDIARLFGADPRSSHPETKNDWPGLSTAALDVANGPGAGRDKSPSEGAATRGIEAPKAPSASPFYAGFGNRITDALSYRSVNIPSSRIFTIDSGGEVKMELLELAGYKSSYIHMTDLVDQMFPPISLEIKKRHAGKPEFNDFNFWRCEIGEFELPDDDELTADPIRSSPTSPALSARSMRTVKSSDSLKSLPAKAETPTSPTEETMPSSASTSRLSRFGLGKLGLSRKGSGQAMAASPSSTSLSDKDTGDATRGVNGDAQKPKRSESSQGFVIDEGPTAQAARRMSPPASPPASYGTGVSAWTANWRRRGTSQPVPYDGQPASPRATSPLMGPVITADPDDLEQDEEEGEEDDDVSSFDGDEDEDNDDNFDGDDTASPQSNRETNERRRRRQRRLPSSVGSAGAEDMLDDDDPLLATGEIRFEWRG